MVLFDAWFGNGDRHLGNWALLVTGFDPSMPGSPGLARFAPMFDTAGCLGAELQDLHRLLAPGAPEHAVEAYARGCKSGYGDGATLPGIYQDEVLGIARTWPEWPGAYNDLFPRIVQALEYEVDDLLAGVPDDWWSEPRRTFARRLLGVRVKFLEGAAP